MSETESAATPPSPASPASPQQAQQQNAPPGGTSPAAPSSRATVALKIGVLVYYGAVLVGSGIVATRPGMLFPAPAVEPPRQTQTTEPPASTPPASAQPAVPSAAARRGDAGSVKPAGLSGKAPPVTVAPAATTTAAPEPAGVTSSASSAAGTGSGADGPPSRPTPGERLFILVLLAGAVGGILHGLTSLAAHAGAGRLSVSWWVFYVARPVVGAGLALVVALVLRSGMLGFAVQDGEAGERVLFAWGALAGLFSSPALKKLKDVFDGVWSQEGPDDKSKPGPAPANKGGGPNPQPGPDGGATAKS
jgi:hypothetical protein